MRKVVELVKTCEACPAQWEGKTDDGKFVYVRYRHGGLSIGFGRTISRAIFASHLAMNDKFQLDGKYDGEMELSELKALTAGEIEWPDVDVHGYSRHTDIDEDLQGLTWNAALEVVEREEMERVG